MFKHMNGVVLSGLQNQPKITDIFIHPIRSLTSTPTFIFGGYWVGKGLAVELSSEVQLLFMKQPEEGWEY